MLGCCAGENSMSELDIFPGGALPRRIPEKCRGVVSHHEWHAVVPVHLAAEFSDRRFRVEESLSSERPQRKDDARFDQLDLADEVGTTCSDLIRHRIPVT